MIPADYDVDGLVRPDPIIAQHKRPRADRVELAAAIGGNRGHAEAAEIVGVHPPDLEGDPPEQPAQRQRQPRRPHDPSEAGYFLYRHVPGPPDLRVDLTERQLVRPDDP